MKLYRSTIGNFVERDSVFYRIPVDDWDTLVCTDRLHDKVHDATKGMGCTSQEIGEILSPVVSQEVWAAGVTYLRSRNARMEEASEAGGGGGSFYDKVYDAERPELFFKATPHRVVGPHGHVRIRSDARWNVPEPEVALAISRRGSSVDDALFQT